MTRRSSIRGVFSALLLLTASLGAGACSTLHVPLYPPELVPEQLYYGTHGDVRTLVFPLEGTETQWQHFGDDLPRLGIGPLWVRVDNGSREPIDLRGLEWTLIVGPSKYRDLRDEQVLRRYHKRKNVRMYTLKAEEKALYSLKNSALPKVAVHPGQSVEGFVFIRIDPTEDAAWSRGGALVADGIKLTGGSKVRIRISLQSHAQR